MSRTKNTEIMKSETIRKIGKTTFIVSSVLAEGSRNEIISTIARLITSDTVSPDAASNSKSA